MSIEYMPGFGNDFETESLEGALPQGQNSPQVCPYGLFAEQLSGSPFTAPRNTNERSWLYRIRPSVKHSAGFKSYEHKFWKSAPDNHETEIPLTQLRWDPFEVPNEEQNFIEGIRSITTAGDCLTQTGMAAHIYLLNESMEDDYFYNAEGELLILPQSGTIEVFTELGRMEVSTGELCVVPRGMIFKVLTKDKECRGYICENYGAKLTLPDRGPIGANCLANPRDFKTPVAAYEDKESACRLHVKWCGRFYKTTLPYSPLDVVAWHGNYAPYKYDLSTFSPVGAILFDHPDPSIFTVLTAPSGEEGTANVDFVIFPPRWLVAEHSFRPPWYHRNIMSEFMGLICGEYDARGEGFVPGGISLHNMMIPHGPDREAYEGASKAELKPQKLSDTMTFMFETRFPQLTTEFALKAKERQSDYQSCWDGLERKFDGTPKAR